MSGPGAADEPVRLPGRAGATLIASLVSLPAPLQVVDGYRALRPASASR